MASQASLATLQDKIWKARLPLEIRLSPSECRTYDQCDPYLVGECFPLFRSRVVLIRTRMLRNVNL